MQNIGVFGEFGGIFRDNARSIWDLWEREGEYVTNYMIDAVVTSNVVRK